MSREVIENPRAHCDSRHAWGGELLHAFCGTGEIVTVRICTHCGVVSIKRETLGTAREPTSV